MTARFSKTIIFNIAVSVLAPAILIAQDAPAAEAKAPWVLEGAPMAWEVEGDVNEGEDVSGAIVLARNNGILVSDETRSVQLFSYDAQGGRVVIGKEIALLPGSGTEVDFEAAALSECGKFAYFTGSHSMARKKKVIQESRANAFQVPLAEGDTALDSRRASQGNFRKAIARLPGLADSLDKPADGTGLDIEGLAEAGGKLFVGFRAPQIDGQAMVMEIGEEEVFGKEQAKPQPIAHRLSLGAGRGIRAMARVPDGFLVVAGNAGEDDPSLDFSLFHWAGAGHPALLVGPIMNAPGKAEGIMVIEAGESGIDCVLWFDGAKNGAPHAIRLVPRKE